MAQRRSLGGAVGQGVGEGLSSLGDALSNLGMKNYESDLIQKRQAELSGLNQKEALQTKALADPQFARRAAALLKKMGIEIPQLTSADAQQPMLDQIGKADTESKIPSQDVIVNSSRLNNQDAFKAGGEQIPIQDTARMVLAARERQAGYTQREADKPVTVPGMDKQGAETQTYSTQGQMAGKTVTKGRSIPQEVSLSNQKAAGEQAAQWAPAIYAKKVQYLRDEANIAATKARTMNNIKFSNDMANTLLGVGADLDEIVSLSAKVNTATSNNLAGRAMEAGGAFTGTNTPAALLNRKITNLATRLANDPMFGGNRGAQSEADRQAMVGKFAKAGTSAELTTELNKFKQEMLDGFKAVSELDPTLSDADRVNTMRSKMGLSALSAANTQTPVYLDENGNEVKQ